MVPGDGDLPAPETPDFESMTIPWDETAPAESRDARPRIAPVG